MKSMLHSTEFGFTKRDGTSSSPIRDEFNVEDVHNFRPEAISRIKEFVQSPAIRGNEIDAIDILYKIGANIPGNNKDILDAYKAAVNNPVTDSITLGYAVHRTAFLLPRKEGEEACKNFTKDALDVFAAVADPQNKYKHNEDTLIDFYHAIMSFASYDHKRVTELVNKMKESDKNTYKSLAMAGRALLAATKIKAGDNQRV